MSHNLTRLNHHSVSDWDWPSAAWKLDTSIYVSAPSSLRTAFNPRNAALCRLAATRNLPQGRLVSWMRDLPTRIPALFFQNQAPLGSTNINDSYCFHCQDTYRKIMLRMAGDAVGVWDYTDGASVAATWVKFRITWWWAYDLQNKAALAMRVEEWDGLTWLDKGTKYDSPRWPASTVNRVGVGQLAVSAGAWTWHDNTEIWIPQP